MSYNAQVIVNMWTGPTASPSQTNVTEVVSGTTYANQNADNAGHDPATDLTTKEGTTNGVNLPVSVTPKPPICSPRR